MNDFKQVLDTDTGDVESHHFCEMPVSGPERANRLVTITGVAISGMDVATNDQVNGDIYIKTDYRLRDQDEYKNIVSGNTCLIAATYVSLASISADDDTDVTFAVNSAIAKVDSVGRIQIHIQAVLQGDATLNRVSYQANILIRKAT